MYTMSVMLWIFNDFACKNGTSTQEATAKLAADTCEKARAVGLVVVNRSVAGAKFYQANAELTRSLQEDPTCRSWPALKADNFHAQLTNLVFGTQQMCPLKALTSQDAAASCKDAEEKETYEAWYLYRFQSPLNPFGILVYSCIYYVQ